MASMFGATHSTQMQNVPSPGSLGQFGHAALQPGSCCPAAMHALAALAILLPPPAAAADNLMRLISVANILPKGLYVENAVKVREGGREQPARLAPCLWQAWGGALFV